MPVGFMQVRKMWKRIIVASFVLSIGGAANAEYMCSPARGDCKSRELLWIVKSQEGIKAKLRDSDSARFRNETVYKAEGAPIVCGEVNSKNGFGGMSGFEGYIAAGTRIAYLQSEFAPGEWNKSVKQVCR